MHSQKLTLNHIIALVFSILSLGILLVSGQTAVASIQKALSIDEKTAASNAPRLNTQSLEKALGLIGYGKTPSVSSPPTSKDSTSSAQKEVAKVSPSPLAVNPPQKVEVINASGITGGAKIASQIFGEGISADLKNNQTGLDETTITYKAQYEGLVDVWKEKLGKLGWTVAKLQQKDNNEKYDVTIILGKNIKP